MLKPGGLFLFTCASTGRPEHGTLRTTKNDSYGTIGRISDMENYYKNLIIQDVDNALNISNNFDYYASYYNSASKDLYFLGIKKCSDSIKYNLPYYQNDHVRSTSKDI
jgi:hypothetical protein